jgi:hypothetical protein
MALRKKCFRFVSALPLEVSGLCRAASQQIVLELCPLVRACPWILLGYAAPGTLYAFTTATQSHAQPQAAKPNFTGRLTAAKPPKRNREERGLPNQRSKLQNVTAELNVPI